MITLSVIIPVYNTRPYLDECLRSLQEQTLRDFEVAMVDDGSTDGSDEVMRRFAGADHRFRCMWQTNSGPSAARNRGLREAQGQYVAFLDCDDWLLSADCMERMCRFMDETGADVAVGHVLSVWPDGRCRTWGEGQEKLFVPGGVTDGESSLPVYGRTAVTSPCCTLVCIGAVFCTDMALCSMWNPSTKTNCGHRSC